MTFFQYLDVRFTNLSMELGMKKEFNIVKDAELKAVHFLVGAQHSFFKWTKVPLVVLDFFLVKLCLKSKPLMIARAPRPEEPVAQGLEALKTTEMQKPTSGPH